MKSTILMIALTGLMLNHAFSQSTLTLNDFTGQFTTNNTVALKWNTMVEINTDYFQVQRSNDGVHFVDLAQVKSQANQSTNVYQLNYSFEDYAPMSGTSYYRLEIVYKDGKTSHSGVIELSNGQVEGLKIFPTVMQNNNLFVQSDKAIRNAKLEIFDLSGKKMEESNWETLSGNQMVSCSYNMHLANGTYLARLTSNGQKLLNQLIIVQGY